MLVNKDFQTWHLIGWQSFGGWDFTHHYSDIIMSTRASQITSISIVYSTICSGADQREHQSSASLAFERGIHRWPVNSPHKGPVMWILFPFDDVIMIKLYIFLTSEWYIRASDFHNACPHLTSGFNLKFPSLPMVNKDLKKKPKYILFRTCEPFYYESKV